MRYNHLNGRPLLEELENIKQWSSTPTLPFFYLEQLNAAPAKTFDGMVVYADGTNWNPGSGKGVYAYYGAAWHYLG